MTRAELKAMAKEHINGNVVTMFITAIVISLVGAACGLVPVIGWMATIVIFPALTLSVTNMYLKMTKKEEVNVGDVFSKFNQADRACWLNIIQQFFLVLWTMLFIIPGIIKSYSYSMSFYILADHPELTAREALSRSKEIMKGHKFELFILKLSFFWWYILGSITFGLAYIYVVPYVNATVANFYNSIKGE